MFGYKRVYKIEIGLKSENENERHRAQAGSMKLNMAVLLYLVPSALGVNR